MSLGIFLQIFTLRQNAPLLHAVVQLSFSLPANFGHSVTQRLHRIVALLAIQGASGAMHFCSPCHPSSRITNGTRMGGTHALISLHRKASTPSGPRAPVGHALIQRPHRVQAQGAPSSPPFSCGGEFMTCRPVTTPLSNNLGPNRGVRRTVLVPADPSPPASATRFKGTTPCTLLSAILTGRYSGTDRAGICSS